jgi:hypothetical protein
MEWRTPIISGAFALVGALGGVFISVWFTGYVEREKQLEIVRSQSLAAYYQWHKSDIPGVQWLMGLYANAKLLVYASPDFIGEMAPLARQGLDCYNNISDECVRSWAKEINLLRIEVGNEPVPEDDIIVLLQAKKLIERAFHEAQQSGAKIYRERKSGTQPKTK